ncbi:RNA polymerase sigma factor [Flavobacterium gawalongense]|uniref:Sigma-70 family RNA polymerase sigma factor n=1 Tax=Flavobacterium gawalongense TaxID=2594432 RepID=A0A553BHY7_9FLAO|nr:sigma-70 family RNA polymerase sigma factor [Flavobacterium gawalongense]TRX07368.1 sigma-70 family RNA polymerase sigma factor [Flavobacterium gawalongense]TRX07868.1 sigma-70 family RNA polymerase sigma factor [Flavobacterium gawalongense]TRX23331.1 sigma-70 family RNA polymerase sigma factor [Flavobacterium gawalongense]
MGLDQIINDCKKNYPKAQEQLYQLFAKKFFGVCLKYSSNYADAQDNLQDGFLIIFRKIEQFSGKGSFEGWAKRIMINNALQKYRGVRYMEVINENIPDTAIEVDDENISIDYLMQIIQELPDQYRLVFSLYVLDGYSHKEVAEMLKITTGTTKSNLARARLILKEKIEAYTRIEIKSLAK